MRKELPAKLPAPVEKQGCVRFTPYPQRRHCSTRLRLSPYRLVQRSRVGSDGGPVQSLERSSIRTWALDSQSRFLLSGSPRNVEWR
ncbi:hypothetical protein NDU88_001501 [Pleurodeles waltl]|uniref:Uncharacterized protein n=1 Tax=Pleurodeles waltl TaxID=8319 RepID=A0AAV7V800_PLEWA|nr:hypothetical protein NDU88_001501 [Pleurodeles waltl]